MLFKELETDRLVLKNIGKNDCEFMLRQFSNDEVNRFLFDAEPFTCIEEAEELIGFYLKEGPQNPHRWIITRKRDGERVGTCGFHCWDRKAGSCHVGYDLYPDYWKQGYMAEALAAILEFAKNEMKIKRMEAHIFTENIDSIRTAERQGFVDSKERYMELFRGKEYPHAIYVLSL
ncbi:MAG: GNAT family N-acetyltransferase [Clostridia bacterium]|nr:GNAT family N-acetyltransferase [Clostridia bacterium]